MDPFVPIIQFQQLSIAGQSCFIDSPSSLRSPSTPDLYSFEENAFLIVFRIITLTSSVP